MRHKNQQHLDRQPVTRKSKVNVVLVAQLHAYAAACKLAKANKQPAPHISQYVK